MARKRMLDPKIWDSQQVMHLSPEAFKTFIYLISQADDAGKLPVCWQMMASRIFPFGEISADKLKDIVTEMDKMNLVILYVVDGNDFIKHPNWTRYQKIDRPSESIIPEPKPFDEHSTKHRRTFVRKLKEEKGIEVKRNGGADAPSSNNELYHSVEKAFLSKNDGKFTDYKKEGVAIHGLLKKASERAPEAQGDLLKTMINQFWKMRCGENKFWKGQPFLPSSLNASGIWDRVLETIRDKVKMADPVAMAVAKGETT